MNKEDYLKEGFRQLANENHYKKLSRDPTKKFQEEVKNTLSFAINQGLITEKEFKILYRRFPRWSNLYLLPKIHKKGNPGRPIINSIGSITEKFECICGSKTIPICPRMQQLYKRHHTFLTINQRPEGPI